MIWATVNPQSCFCWLYRAFPFSLAKNIINLPSVLTIWRCPCVNCPIYIQFMELTFQVPMQYCSLQHQGFILTSGHTHIKLNFHFGPITSFFSRAISNCSQLFPSSIFDTFWQWGLSSGVISFCLFILLMGFSWQDYWSDLPFPFPVDCGLSGLFTNDPSVLGGLAWHGSLLHWFTEAPLSGQGCDPWRGFNPLDMVFFMISEDL